MLFKITNMSCNNMNIRYAIKKFKVNSPCCSIVKVDAKYCIAITNEKFAVQQTIGHHGVHSKLCPVFSSNYL